MGHPYFTPLSCSIQCLPDIVKGNCRCQLTHMDKFLDSDHLYNRPLPSLHPFVVGLFVVYSLIILPDFLILKERKLNLNTLLGTLCILFRINLVAKYTKLHCSSPRYLQTYFNKKWRKLQIFSSFPLSLKLLDA